MRTRRQAIALLLAAPAGAATALAQSRTPATLYKTPQCGCCEGYARYLRRNGFDVTTIESHDMPLLKRQHGVPDKLEGCHTTLVENYVVEGHVPIRAIKKLLTERPAITGISLPGMPEGSPGMSGQKAEPFTTYAIRSDGNTDTVFDVE